MKSTVIIKQILSKGMYLNTLGVENWGLTRDQALFALNQLRELNVPVLGGDVCEIINDIIRYNYDNWYCEQNLDESNLSFVVRSIDIARDYLENYHCKNDINCLFVLVPQIQT
jgi:hypothetical protein